MFRLASAVLSHPGLRREENEDAYCVREDLGLYLIADGMGGHAAGEIASRMAAEAIEAFIDETRDSGPDRPWPGPYDQALSLDGNRLKAAFRLANRRIAAGMADDAALRGMATTAAAVLYSGRQAPVVAHVGDSRVYHLRGGALDQITEDHSWVREQVRAGVLTEADAKRHPWKNVVTRALSGGEDPGVDVRDLDVAPGDRLLICSDGLSSVVAADRLADLAGRQAPLDEICRALVDAANDAGGPDNITVALLQIHVA